MNTDILTTEEVAAALHISPRRVRALARSRGVGRQIARGVWLFRPEDLELLRPGRPGRPGGMTKRLTDDDLWDRYVSPGAEIGGLATMPLEELARQVRELQEADPRPDDPDPREAAERIQRMAQAKLNG